MTETSTNAPGRLHKAKAFLVEVVSTHLDKSGFRLKLIAAAVHLRVRSDRRQADEARPVARGPEGPEERGIGCGLGRAPRSSRSQRSDPRHRHQDYVGLRRTAPHHRQGRGGGTAHRRPAGRRRERASRPTRLAQGFRLGQARRHGKAAERGLSPRPAGDRLPAREPAHLPQRSHRGPCARLHQPRQPGHRRDGEVGRRPGARRPEGGRLRHQFAGLEADPAVDRPQGDPGRTRRARQGRRALQGQGRRRRGAGRQYRRGDRLCVPARLRPQQSGRRARSQSHQPAQRRRLRDGLDLQGDFGRHGDRRQQGDAAQHDRRARQPALRPLHHP